MDYGFKIKLEIRVHVYSRSLYKDLQQQIARKVP